MSATIDVPIDTLKDTTVKALVAIGHTQADAEVVADTILFAEIRANNQGLIKLVAGALKPSPNAIDFIRRHYDLEKTKFNIGVAWKGGSAGTASVYRTLDLQTLAHCFSEQPIKLYSLQYKENKADLAEFNATNAYPINPFLEQELDDLDHLAALIDQLDLVLTVQNTNVHLSGAIGKKCIALLPYAPEWRYGMEGTSMVWYQSVHLVRQSRLGQWDDVITNARGLIDQAVAAWKGSGV